jgi:hypothetical protein
MADPSASMTVGKDTLPIDPRTQLQIIDIPPEHAKYFSVLKGTVIHWFGIVDKFNRMWHLDRRVAIFSDSCIYLCRLDGGITRCVHVRNIARVLIGENNAIGFQINSPDYDLLIQLGNVQEREAVLNIVRCVYYRIVGQDLDVAKLSDEASQAMQQELRLTKPPNATLRIEPIRSIKALMKTLDDQKRKEEDDKKVVEQEFLRIKEGLRKELQLYRTEEYERVVDQLTKVNKALEERDREISRLTEETVSKDDPELWKQCPNCARMHERLSSNSNDDKQKIMRLEREIESQQHIMEHLKAAIQFRTTNQTGATGGDADSGQLNAVRAELADANRRNKELMQLITQSNVLTSEMKQRAARIANHRDGATATTGYTSSDWSELVAEKEREAKHLKGLLRDSTFRHVQELESIRGQFQRYDEQIVDYLEKVFAGAIPASGRGGTPAQVAQATARAAKEAAGGGAGGLPPPGNGGAAGSWNNAAVTNNGASARSMYGGGAAASSPTAAASSSPYQRSSGPATNPGGYGGGGGASFSVAGGSQSSPAGGFRGYADPTATNGSSSFAYGAGGGYTGVTSSPRGAGAAGYGGGSSSPSFGGGAYRGY